MVMMILNFFFLSWLVYNRDLDKEMLQRRTEWAHWFSPFKRIACARSNALHRADGSLCAETGEPSEMKMTAQSTFFAVYRYLKCHSFVTRRGTEIFFLEYSCFLSKEIAKNNTLFSWIFQNSTKKKKIENWPNVICWIEKSSKLLLSLTIRPKNWQKKMWKKFNIHGDVNKFPNSVNSIWSFCTELRKSQLEGVLVRTLTVSVLACMW